MQTPPTSWPRPCRALASHASAAAPAPRQLSRPSALPPPNTSTATFALLKANLRKSEPGRVSCQPRTERVAKSAGVAGCCSVHCTC